MDSKTLKWLGVIALIAALFISGSAKVSVGGTDNQTGQPVVVTAPAPDSGQAAVDETADGLLKAIPQLISTAALGGLVAAIFNLVKVFPGTAGKLDGKTGAITSLVNVIVFIAITAANYFGYGDRVRTIFEQTGNAVPSMLSVVTVLGGLLASFGGSAGVHALMKKINAQSFSFSARIEQAVASVTDPISKFLDDWPVAGFVGSSEAASATQATPPPGG